MPISAVLAAVATWGPFGAAIGSLSLFSSFLVRTALGLGLNLLSGALTPKGGSQGYNINGESGSALDHQIIYGRVKVGGARVYDATTGRKNKFLHRILAFAGHEIEGFDEVYINEDSISFGTSNIYVYTLYRQVKETQNDNEYIAWETEPYTVELPVAPANLYEVGEYFDAPTIAALKGTTNYYQDVVGVRVTARTLDTETAYSNPRYKGAIRLKKYVGTDTQAADTDLIAESSALTDGRWTSDHKLSGIAYIYARLEFRPNVFPNGVPTISAVIKGRKVYDPRSLTTAWSENPALCIRDYLTAPFGLNVDSTKIDEDSFIEAANICDEVVDTAPRYTLNGAFTTATSPDRILSDMLTSCGGILWFSQGKWRIKVAKWSTPVLDLDEDDLRSNIKLATRHSRKDTFNSVKGTFSGEQSDWQETDYPAVTDATALATDNGVPNVLDMPLKFTKTSAEARRLARVALNRNREQLSISASFGSRALALSVGDIIRLTNTRFGWTNKTFEVMTWSYLLGEDGGFVVNLTLREISAAVFTAGDTAVFEKNNTSLPNPFDVPAVSINLSDELRVINEQVTGVLLVEVNAEDGGLDRVQVQYKKSDKSIWRSVGTGEPGIYEAFNIVDGNYDVRARGINSLGISGDWTEVINWYASPYGDPPTDVTDFAGNVVGDKLFLTWEPSADLDLSHYRIRYSPDTAGATYANAVDLVQKVSRPAVSISVPARTGTYFIRSFDKLGNGSLSPASFVVIEDAGDILPTNVVETILEYPDYTGAKTNTVVTSDSGSAPYVTLDSQTLFDDSTGLFDDALGFFDGYGGIQNIGYYQFGQVIDLGIKQVSKAQVKFNTLFLNYADDFDSTTGLFDDREGLFDGDASLFDTINVKSQISTTDDDPSGSPTWSAWKDFVVGQVSARAMRFRIVLVSREFHVAPAVTQLRAIVDMPDRIISENDLTFTGATTITFDNPFRATPAVTLDLANLNSGQYHRVTAKTKSGFTVTVYDSGGAVATNSTTLDYVAKGYGKEL